MGDAVRDFMSQWRHEGSHDRLADAASDSEVRWRSAQQVAQRWEQHEVVREFEADDVYATAAAPTWLSRACASDKDSGSRQRGVGHDDALHATQRTKQPRVRPQSATTRLASGHGNDTVGDRAVECASRTRPHSAKLSRRPQSASHAAADQRALSPSSWIPSEMKDSKWTEMLVRSPSFQQQNLIRLEHETYDLLQSVFFKRERVRAVSHHGKHTPGAHSTLKKANTSTKHERKGSTLHTPPLASVAKRNAKRGPGRPDVPRGSGLQMARIKRHDGSESKPVLSVEIPAVLELTSADNRWTGAPTQRASRQDTHSAIQNQLGEDTPFVSAYRAAARPPRSKSIRTPATKTAADRVMGRLLSKNEAAHRDGAVYGMSSGQTSSTTADVCGNQPRERNRPLAHVAIADKTSRNQQDRAVREPDLYVAVESSVHRLDHTGSDGRSEPEQLPELSVPHLVCATEESIRSSTGAAPEALTRASYSGQSAQSTADTARNAPCCVLQLSASIVYTPISTDLEDQPWANNSSLASPTESDGENTCTTSCSDRTAQENTPERIEIRMTEMGVLERLNGEVCAGEVVHEGDFALLTGTRHLGRDADEGILPLAAKSTVSPEQSAQETSPLSSFDEQAQMSAQLSVFRLAMLDDTSAGDASVSVSCGGDTEENDRVFAHIDSQRQESDQLQLCEPVLQVDESGFDKTDTDEWTRAPTTEHHEGSSRSPRVAIMDDNVVAQMSSLAASLSAALPSVSSKTPRIDTGDGVGVACALRPRYEEAKADSREHSNCSLAFALSERPACGDNENGGDPGCLPRKCETPVPPVSPVVDDDDENVENEAVSAPEVDTPVACTQDADNASDSRKPTTTEDVGQVNQLCASALAKDFVDSVADSSVIVRIDKRLSVGSEDVICTDQTRSTAPLQVEEVTNVASELVDREGADTLQLLAASSEFTGPESAFAKLETPDQEIMDQDQDQQNKSRARTDSHMIVVEAADRAESPTSSLDKVLLDIADITHVGETRPDTSDAHGRRCVDTTSRALGSGSCIEASSRSDLDSPRIQANVGEGIGTSKRSNDAGEDDMTALSSIPETGVLHNPVKRSKIDGGQKPDTYMDMTKSLTFDGSREDVVAGAADPLILDTPVVERNGDISDEHGCDPEASHDGCAFTMLGVEYFAACTVEEGQEQGPRELQLLSPVQIAPSGTPELDGAMYVHRTGDPIVQINGESLLPADIPDADSSNISGRHLDTNGRLSLRTLVRGDETGDSYTTKVNERKESGDGANDAFASVQEDEVVSRHAARKIQRQYRHSVQRQILTDELRFMLSQHHRQMRKKTRCASNDLTGGLVARKSSMSNLTPLSASTADETVSPETATAFVSPLSETPDLNTTEATVQNADVHAAENAQVTVSTVSEVGGSDTDVHVMVAVRTDTAALETASSVDQLPAEEEHAMASTETNAFTAESGLGAGVVLSKDDSTLLADPSDTSVLDTDTRERQIEEDPFEKRSEAAFGETSITALEDRQAKTVSLLNGAKASAKATNEVDCRNAEGGCGEPAIKKADCELLVAGCETGASEHGEAGGDLSETDVDQEALGLVSPSTLDSLVIDSKTGAAELDSAWQEEVEELEVDVVPATTCTSSDSHATLEISDAIIRARAASMALAALAFDDPDGTEPGLNERALVHEPSSFQTANNSFLLSVDTTASKNPVGYWERYVDVATSKSFYFNPNTQVSQWTTPEDAASVVNRADEVNLLDESQASTADDAPALTSDTTTQQELQQQPQPVLLDSFGGWSQYLERGSGTVFYYHHERGEYAPTATDNESSRTEPPLEFTAAKLVSLQQTHGSSIAAATTLTSSSDEREASGVHSTDTGASEQWRLRHTSSTTAETRGEWQAFTDPESLHTFYYNAHTGESTWEVPPVFMEADTALESADSQWSAYIDDVSGVAYYVNAATGETTWEKPTDVVGDTGVLLVALSERTLGQAAAGDDTEDDDEYVIRIDEQASLEQHFA